MSEQAYDIDSALCRLCKWNWTSIKRRQNRPWFSGDRGPCKKHQKASTVEEREDRAGLASDRHRPNDRGTRQRNLVFLCFFVCWFRSCRVTGASTRRERGSFWPWESGPSDSGNYCHCFLFVFCSCRLTSSFIGLTATMWIDGGKEVESLV